MVLEVLHFKLVVSGADFSILLPVLTVLL